MEDRGGTALAGIEESIVKSSKEIFALLEQVGAEKHQRLKGRVVCAAGWLAGCTAEHAWKCSISGARAAAHRLARMCCDPRSVHLSHAQGSAKRRTAETLLNKQSSRSHSGGCRGRGGKESALAGWVACSRSNCSIIRLLMALPRHLEAPRHLSQTVQPTVHPLCAHPASRPASCIRPTQCSL